MFYVYTMYNVNKNPTRCNNMQIFIYCKVTLYMFRVSQHPSSGVLKTVTAAYRTGHNTGTATSLQSGLIGTAMSRSGQYFDLYRRLRLQFLVLLTMGAVTTETCRVTLQ